MTLRRSDWIIGGGAIALFVFLFFFKWFGLHSTFVGGIGVDHSVNGWHFFTTSRWVWLITIVVALGAVVQRARGREPRLPMQSGVIVAGLGALSTVLILYRIVHHPSGSGSEGAGVNRYSYSFGIELGIWLALLAAATIAYGGYLAMQAEDTSLADEREGSASAPDDPPIAPAGAPAPGPPASDVDEGRGLA